MKLILIAALMISLEGCNFPELKEPLERCVLKLEYSRCRCHQYEISKDNIGRVGDSIDHPIEYCSRLVGFRPDEWGTLRLWFEGIFLWLKDKEEE